MVCISVVIGSAQQAKSGKLLWTHKKYEGILRKKKKSFPGIIQNKSVRFSGSGFPETNWNRIAVSIFWNCP
jgi:hypothetical protein